MFETPMFLDKRKLNAFEKVAVVIRVPDDVSKWAPQILSELHRQAPVMKDFHSEIVLDRTDPNKGAGFGYIVATPRTPDPLQSAGLPRIKVPVFVKSWHLSPLDIFYDDAGRGYRLSERRIREALLRPEAASGTVSPDSPVSSDIRNMMTPPWENVGQFYRGVNTQVSQAAQTKTSSLLSAISGTAHPDDLTKLATWVKSDEGRSALWGQHDVLPRFRAALQLSSADYASETKTASVNGSAVIQYTWDGGPLVMVKVAQPGGFAPQQGQMPAQQAMQGMSPEQQQQLSQQGQVTQAPQAEVMSPMEMEGDSFNAITEFGVHRVITVNSEQLMGWVFPFVLSFRMEKLPLQLFTDGTHYAVQPQVAGVHVSANSNLPNEQPQGRGFFYIIRNGRAFAFTPMEIMGEQPQPDGSVMFIGTTLMDNAQVMVMRAQGMRAAAEMGDGQFAIPGDARWASLKQQSNELVADAQQATQRAGAYVVAQAQQQMMLQQQQAAQAQQSQGKGRKKQASLVLPALAEIRQTREGSYSLGGNAFNKLAAADRHFVNYADTEWLLALAGVDPAYTQTKLAALLREGRGYTEIPVLREVHPPVTFTVKTAAISKVSKALQRDLIKHAAEIRDPHIADTLLSLNFLNPRNISMFISYLPIIEETSSQLVNLIVAARLGETTLNEGACAEALRNLEDVIMGLRMLTMSREDV
jgi:hypothetical protein